MAENKARDLRKEEIVNAAVEEFLDKGYEKASMEGIAVRSGLSKGGLYHHFRSKDEILIYAMRKITEPLYELYDRIGTIESADRALEVYIKDYMQFWINNVKPLSGEEQLCMEKKYTCQLEYNLFGDPAFNPYEPSNEG